MQFDVITSHFNFNSEHHEKYKFARSLELHRLKWLAHCTNHQEVTT